jgi:homoserine O-acetyltransferase
MRDTGRQLLWAGALLVALAATAHAFDGLVEKKPFTIPAYNTVGGKTIKNLAIGYETYGRLTPARDNVILITHFFSGSSHAAGKYKADDKAPGYWDAIIGAGRAIDTDRFFVIAVDTPVNINTHDPNVITTGPQSINPDTGKPYGMSFPVLSMRDFVQTQKALLDSLGIAKLYAVAGASGGAIQAIEWAADYPDMVERAVAVIGPGYELQPLTIAVLNTWSMPILMDPNWNKGDYYDKTPPDMGVAQAFKQVIVSASGMGGAERTFGRKAAKPEADPGKEYANDFAIEAAWMNAGLARAKISDANAFLYMTKANQLFAVDPAAIKARILFVPSKSDTLFPPWMSHRAAEKLRSLGKSAEVFEIDGDGGHYDGLFKVAFANDRIKDFLAK